METPESTDMDVDSDYSDEPIGQNNSACFHYPGKLLAPQSNQCYTLRALLILNVPIPSPQLLRSLWQATGYRICADGGANRLYDLFEDDPDARATHLPDRIHGDLDSLRPDVKKYYSRHGVSVSRDPDQNSTDFGKNMQKIREQSNQTDLIILGSLGGRVDQGLGLLGEMLRETVGNADELYLVSPSSLTFLLKPINNIISFPPGCISSDTSSTGSSPSLFTENVGILPIYGPAIITTKGFEWDVRYWSTEMGEQVSTSNHLRPSFNIGREYHDHHGDDGGARVLVQTDQWLLFTVELDPSFTGVGPE